MGSVIGVDQFAKSINDMMKNINTKLAYNLEPAIRQSAIKGRRTTARVARRTFRSDSSPVRGRYSLNFSYKMKKTGYGVSAEVGNKKYPGLVHLLEKGHKTVGGNDVKAYPHVIDGANDAFEELEKRVDAAVEKALK